MLMHDNGDGTFSLKVNGGGSTPTLAEVLVAGNDPGGTRIVAAAGGSGGQGAQWQLSPGTLAGGGQAYVAGGNAAGAGTGGLGIIQGGDNDDANKYGAQFIANPATASTDGKAAIQSDNSQGNNGDLFRSDGTYATWQPIYSQAAAPPGGTLTTLIYGDTTAVTGGLYVWNASAYRKVSGTLP